MQFVQTLVDESPEDSDLTNPRKRRFEEIDNEDAVKSEPSSSETTASTNPTIVANNVKIEYDEETSTAASILNNVSQNRPVYPSHLTLIIRLTHSLLL